jgi:hypothetical protein
MNQKHDSLVLMASHAHVCRIDDIDYAKVTSEVIQQDLVFSSGYGFLVYPKSNECQKLQNSIESLANQILPSQMLLTDIWAVATYKGESVGYHSHHSNTHMQPTEYWSGVVYTSSDDSSAELVLHSFGYNRIESMTKIKPEIGKVVFFNSYVPHFTTMHQSNIPRVAVSFNLKPINPNTTEIPDMNVYRGIHE